MESRARHFTAPAGLLLVTVSGVALAQPSQSSGDWISPSSIGPSPGESTHSSDYVRKPTEPPPFDPATPPAVDPKDVTVTTFPAEEETATDTPGSSSPLAAPSSLS